MRLTLVAHCLFALLGAAAVSCKTPGSQAGSGIRDASAAAGPSSAVWLNDVSILIPLKQPSPNQTPSPFFATTLQSTDTPAPQTYAPGADAAPLDGLPFIPDYALKSLDQQLVADNALRKAAGKDPQKFADVQDDGTFFSNSAAGKMHAIAVRFDPCANPLQAAGDDSKCLRQIRILWQVFDHNGTAADENIHTVYQVDQPTFAKVVQELLALQAASGLNYAQEPLAAHPVIVKQGVNSPYLKGIYAIIHRYVRASQMFAIAGLGEDSTDEGRTSWVMTSVAFANGQPAIGSSPIATTVPFGSTPALVQRFAGEDTDMDNPTPASSTIVPTVTANNSPTLAPVENPLLHDLSNTDCGSCHQALQARQGTQPPVTAQTYASTTWNLANKSADNDAQSLQMLSIGRSGEYAISQRVVNESAFVADYINKNYLGGSSPDATGSAASRTQPAPAATAAPTTDGANNAGASDTGTDNAGATTNAAPAASCGANPHITATGRCFSKVNGNTSQQVDDSCCPQ